jgi:hypothetical protein
MAVDRSLSDLTRDLAANVSDLFRNEVRLARAEAVENVKDLAGGLARLALGLAVAGAAVTLALAALAAALSMVMPMWAGALIAAIVGGVIAYALVSAGRKALSTKPFAMPRTARSVSRDIHTIKEKASP